MILYSACYLGTPPFCSDIRLESNNLRHPSGSIFVQNHQPTPECSALDTEKWQGIDLDSQVCYVRAKEGSGLMRRDLNIFVISKGCWIRSDYLLWQSLNEKLQTPSKNLASSDKQLLEVLGGGRIHHAYGDGEVLCSINCSAS